MLSELLPYQSRVDVCDVQCRYFSLADQIGADQNIRLFVLPIISFRQFVAYSPVITSVYTSLRALYSAIFCFLLADLVFFRNHKGFLYE